MVADVIVSKVSEMVVVADIIAVIIKMVRCQCKAGGGSDCAES